MVNFNTVSVAGNDWVDINTLSTAPAGTAISIQNVGMACVRLQESSAKPTNDNGGVLFTADYGDNFKAIFE